jgi:IS5 family transposase
MVRRAFTQRSLVEVLLPDADKLWDPALRRIDTLLDDEDLVDRIADALARRLFEPYTEIIRKGKLAKPTEFGRLLKIQEAEAQFITDYQVCERGVPDRALWVPALDRHIALFGRPPHLAVADGGVCLADE